ncbi:MAG TPA: aminoglycoside phosphotransferase family protein [Bryobacteraceae bacterium]|nr:aminoglycoside phosphotransferase family protein [Bryobacteraceae bacterium]
MAVAPEIALRDLAALGVLPAGAPARLCPLAGGISSDIVKVESGGRVFVVKRALARLRVAEEWLAPISRNRHEADWLETIGRILPGAVPKVLARNDDAGLFAMEYLAPERFPVWKEQLRDGHVDIAFAAEVGRRLAAIHRRTAGDAAIAGRFATGPIFHAIRLEPYLEATARRHPEIAGNLMALSAETLAAKIALVHGDVSPKNILAGPRGPVFLDAECAWYGDPAFDLAFCLNHLLLKCLWNRPAAPRLMEAFESLLLAYGTDDAMGQRTAHLLAALLLARVDGKSPVEYLGDAERDLVRRFSVPLIAVPPRSLAAIQRAWAARLGI